MKFMKPRSLFSFPWLALVAAALLMALTSIASAQNATPASQASVTVSASPPTLIQPVAITADTYTLTLSALALPVATTKAQGSAGTVSPWSGAFFYDVRSRTLDAVVLNKVLDLTKNTKLSGFSLYGFAGTTVDKNGKAVAGLSIGKDWKWFDQVSFFTGIGVSFSASQPIGGGVIVGASIHF